MIEVGRLPGWRRFFNGVGSSVALAGDMGIPALDAAEIQLKSSSVTSRD